MKKVLVVHAHPEKKSYCSALTQETIAHFEGLGAQVQVSDLYQIGFNTLGDRTDFQSLENPDFSSAKFKR